MDKLAELSYSAQLLMSMIIITSAPHRWEIKHPVLSGTNVKDQLTAFLQLWSHD